MKILKTIRLHRKLRIRQDYLYNRVLNWTYKNIKETESPYLREYGSINKALITIEKKLPIGIFVLSDIFLNTDKKNMEITINFK